MKCKTLTLMTKSVKMIATWFFCIPCSPKFCIRFHVEIHQILNSASQSALTFIICDAVEMCNVCVKVRNQHQKTWQVCLHGIHVFRCHIVKSVWAYFIMHAEQDIPAVTYVGEARRMKPLTLVLSSTFPLLSSTPPRYYNMTGVKDLWPAALLLRVQLSTFISSIFPSSLSFLFNLLSNSDIIEIDLCYCKHSMCLHHDNKCSVYPNTSDMKTCITRYDITQGLALSCKITVSISPMT